MTDLTGKIAVVTGSAGGIGRDYARALALHGATVVLADIDVAGAEKTAQEITAEGGTAVAIGVDISSKESTLSLAAEVKERFGTAHIVVNNAAIIVSSTKHPQLTIDIDLWRKVFSVNLDGALLVTQAFAPLLVEAGWGRVIIQTSSGAYSGAGVYNASKLALLSLIRGFAQELGRSNITVNGIAPGPILTQGMLDSIPAERLTQIRAAQCIDRSGETQDLVGPLLFLCGKESGWVTGQTLLVDGGSTWRL
jgi:NAD(P)-dependent dehydrogenase (short-subunit alcohol dehydrogenase family)